MIERSDFEAEGSVEGFDELVQDMLASDCPVVRRERVSRLRRVVKRLDEELEALERYLDETAAGVAVGAVVGLCAAAVSLCNACPGAPPV